MSWATRSASSPTSSISEQNLGRTCGKCHQKQARQYADSVHGRAVAHGIHDSPTCADCHEEHLILPPKDPRSPVHPENISSRVCAHCHQNPEMAAKYGLPPEVIASYKDSYATPRPTPPSPPATITCSRGKRMPHDVARIIYLWLLGVVLGGMLLHNLVIYGSDLRCHFKEQRASPAVQRMLSRLDLWLHAMLILTFFALALSGFALRSPDAWWVRGRSSPGTADTAGCSASGWRPTCSSASRWPGCSAPSSATRTGRRSSSGPRPGTTPT